jgi:homoserine/homoserine lactone efflux protein
MATTFAVIEFLTEYLLVRLACQIRPWHEQGGKRFNRFCGSLFVLIGAALPMTR